VIGLWQRRILPFGEKNGSVFAREAYRIRDGVLAKSRVRSDGPDLNAQGILPGYLTRLVGRSSELEDLLDRLELAID
jgi:hypothetical protein